MPPRPIKTLTSYRGAAVAAAAVLALTVSGCATGFNAETNREYAPAVGTNAREDDISVLNALFVTNPDQTATLSTVLLDSAGDDTLTGVEVTSDDGQVDATIEEPIQLERGVSFSVGEEPNVVIEGSFIPGQFLRTTLTFADAGEISFRAIVVERTAEYREVAAPSIVPTESEPTESEPTEPGSSAAPSDSPSTEPTPSDEPTS
ncbi:hypothetical protein [Solicola sp. PLA-1-18]|uniref:hypothetical protein n=1 Tax=Solicola sp. PLA-1-18 TaxID=3380532 RepID=UPI003B7DE128